MSAFEKAKFLTKDQVFLQDKIESRSDLEMVVYFLESEGYETNDRALKGMCEAEKYLQQAYAGRYLFELIQNVRDANRQAGIDGSVFIEVNDAALTIANTGSPFTKKGIRSISTIGDSTKDSRDFIGFKGIGFKSIQEVTETPKIVTRHGSIIFDRIISWPFVAAKVEKIQNVPLFFIPHFSQETLSESEVSAAIVTKVILPLKPGISPDDIDGGFDGISAQQLVLLGNLKHIAFSNSGRLKYFDIDTHRSTGKVTVKTVNETFYYKLFRPTQSILIPAEVIQKLDEKERELFEKDPVAEISLVFDLTETGRLREIEKAKLYLYYPLEIHSGFKFLIHSCFIVTPERKDLRDTLLNDFLLEKIADYLTGEWLAVAKRNHKTTFIDFLAFKRNKEKPILDKLYDRILINLKKKDFIWDAHTERFYTSEQVIIGDGFDKGLFEDNRIENKQIVYTDHVGTRDWLKDEMKVDYLSYETIKDHIEKECVRQLKKDNIDFFNHLYRYLVEHDSLNLKGRKVLLTSQRKLMSNEDHVFYGMSATNRPNLPEKIARKIYFSHPKIKISEQRQGKGQTGFQEFNTELFVTRLLDLYEEPNPPLSEILAVLVDVQVRERLYPTVKSKIKLPLKSGKWVNPLDNPVYIVNQHLTGLYPETKFIDLNAFEHSKLTIEELNKRLVLFGAWDIPGIYYTAKAHRVLPRHFRFAVLRSMRWYNTPYFEQTGDWSIDLPSSTNEWITQSIIGNWLRYSSLILHENSPAMKYRSQTSYTYDIDKHLMVSATSVVETLRTTNWIQINGHENSKSADEVVGLDSGEYYAASASVYRKYLTILKINYLVNQHFVQAIGLKHLDQPDLENWKVLLAYTYNTHSSLAVDKREFVLFYNKILNKLYEFYDFQLEDKTFIRQLKSSFFLAIDEQQNTLSWKKAEQTFYMDDKPGYDILPPQIKLAIQPQFINRDKNRFGKIAGQIGQSFRQTIRQELVDDHFQSAQSMAVFFPRLAECLALTERYLDITLHKDLDRIKKSQVKIKEQILVRVFNNKKFIQELSVDYKVILGKETAIFAVAKPSTAPSIYFARLFNDFLTELLGRDLQRLQNVVADFLTRKDNTAFLQTYDVDFDRIQEINEALNDKLLDERQLFWRDLLLCKRFETPLSLFEGNSIDFHLISAGFKVDLRRLEMIANAIHYKALTDVTNIKPLTELFKMADVSLQVFNDYSTNKIDFSEYYVRKFEGIKSRLKKRFENVAYNNLLHKSFKEQSGFQDIMDSYTLSFRAEIEGPVLTMDINAYFYARLRKKFSFVGRTFDVNKLIDLGPVFEKNRLLLKAEITRQTLDIENLAEFLSYNINRSPIYFGRIKEVARVYASWANSFAPDDSENPNGDVQELSGYFNDPSTTIEESTTSSVEIKEEDGNESNHGGGGGNRPDGSEQSKTKLLIGLVSEKLVYELLKQKYQQVEWVSKNAAKAKVEPEGHDRWGYDMTYVDDDDHVHYVEVKGKSDQVKHFYISYSEIRVANREKKYYHVLFVSDALDNTKRKFHDLGNIFMLDQLEDIFHNSRFTAKFNLLEIIFN